MFIKIQSKSPHKTGVNFAIPEFTQPQVEWFSQWSYEASVIQQKPQARNRFYNRLETSECFVT